MNHPFNAKEGSMENGNEGIEDEGNAIGMAQSTIDEEN
jgi:hypothetical protein